jgi:muconolactone delta-isomerase
MNSQQDSRRRFMVALAFDVPAGQQQAMAALIPQEQAHIRELAAQGRVETVDISADRSHVWRVMRGDSPDDITQALTSFPLYPYMRPDITALLPQ